MDSDSMRVDKADGYKIRIDAMLGEFLAYVEGQPEIRAWGTTRGKAWAAVVMLLSERS